MKYYIYVHEHKLYTNSNNAEKNNS